MKIIDLSVPLEDGLPVDPPQQIAHIKYIDHEEGVSSMLSMFPGTTKKDLLDEYGWAVEEVKMGTHTGTHMDAPWHFHPTMNKGERAWSIDEVPLEWCMGNGVMVDFSDKPDGYVCTSEDFIAYFDSVNYQLSPGDIVLIHTSAMEFWGSSEYMLKGCGIGREATLWLCEQGIHITGTDAWSWDAPLFFEAKQFELTHDASVIWEGHKAGAETIYCHMEKMNNLDKLPAFGFRVIALPINVKKASAGWVRPIAIID